MANRVLIGKRGSEHGLFISQTGQDVLTASNLSFDSTAGPSIFVAGASTALKGEGSLAAPSSYSGTTSTTVSHGLGYVPAYAVRWCYPADLSSGVAVRMYNPSETNIQNIEYSGEEYNEEDEYNAYGGVNSSCSSTTLTITNFESGINEQTSTASIIYYAYVIFTAPDFTGGHSL
jgi:hypothetical protein